MKKTVLTTLLVVINVLLSSGQNAPAAFNYQGIARDSSGHGVGNQNIQLRFRIWDSVPSVAATLIFTEVQQTTTNADGLFNVHVGTVTQTLGTLAWGLGMKFFTVEVDVSGGTSFVFAGRTQLISVPYAQHANSAGEAKHALKSDTAQVAKKLEGFNPYYNPNFPGGKYDSIVFLKLYKGVPYTPPAGYILYFTNTYCKNYSGNTFSNFYSSGLVYPGHNIYTNLDSMYNISYLIKDKGYNIVNIDDNVSYTVPAGKKLVAVNSSIKFPGGFQMSNGYEVPRYFPAGTQIIGFGTSGYLIDE